MHVIIPSTTRTASTSTSTSTFQIMGGACTFRWAGARSRVAQDGARAGDLGMSASGIFRIDWCELRKDQKS
jgi:hypothetical protein